MDFLLILANPCNILQNYQEFAHLNQVGISFVLSPHPYFIYIFFLFYIFSLILIIYNIYTPR